MNVQLQTERGVGLVEVLMALAVLMFAALSISTLQTNAHISMQISEAHFSVNEQAQDMLEVLRTNTDNARVGSYNTDYDEVITSAAGESVAFASIRQWKTRINSILPDGAGKIECDADKCTVSVRWSENIDGSAAHQFFNMAGPI